MQFKHNYLAVLGLVAGGILLGTSSLTANASLTPSSTLPKTDMVDVSSWQGSLTAADYQTMANNGVKAVTIKPPREPVTRIPI
ncbi:hypothetical protein [Lentilactobacillus parafarraginis]|uniref:hypothetical protein n=1 Tax=Lentilactobacillus parafarraginis TaxID=390842 RepID=UPI000A7F5B18|nr:hypothetical protein [Lentilactobacillus parafarraginis]